MLKPNKQTVINEYLLKKFIPITTYKYEVEFYQSKFKPYYQLHPTEATALFFEAYKKYLRRHRKMTLDVDSAERNIGYLSKHFADLGSKTIQQFWEARQVADSLGIEYEYYLSEYFRISRDWCFNRDLKPRELAFPKVVDEIAEGWSDYKKYCLVDAEKIQSDVTNIYSQIEIV